MKNLVLILFSFVSFSIFAQENVKGTIKDEKQQAVFAANVYWKNHTHLGVTSDFSGNFSIQKVNDTLVVSFIGYESQMIPWKKINDPKNLLIHLKSNCQQLSAITVKAKDPVAEKFSVVKLQKLDVYLNPIASGDPLKAITFLPSSTNADEMANPSIRGSEPDKSRVILNGVPVLKPVRNSQINGMGNFSLFNTEIIHKQYVYASNPPLTYGNTSAGIVEIETIRELDNNLLQIASSLATSGLFLSKKIGKKAFIQAYGNRQYSDPFLEINKKSTKEINQFDSKDFGFNFQWKPGKKISMNSFNYIIDEEYDVDAYRFAYYGKSMANNKRWISIQNLNYQLKNGMLMLNTGWDDTRNTYEFGNLYSESKNQSLYIALNYKHIFAKRNQIQLGVKEVYKSFRFSDSIPQYYYNHSPEAPAFYSKSSVDHHNPEFYLFSSFYINDRLMLSAGIRTNLPVDDQDAYLSAQFSLKYDIDKKQTLLLSGGKYHSYFTPNYYVRDFSMNRSYQFALDYDINFEKSSWHAAIYYKKDKGDWTDSDYQSYHQTKIIGIELALKQSIGKYLQFTCSNTFLNQKVESDGKWYDGEKDLDYFIKTSLSFHHPKYFNASLVWMGRPGLRYTRIESANFIEKAKAYQPNFAKEINGNRYKAYRSFNFNASRMFPLGRNSLLLFASVTNMLDQKNQESLEYNSDYTKSIDNYYGRRIYYFGVIFHLRGKK